MLPKYFSKKYNSTALPENTVVIDGYRFTVLTDSLIRLEYDKDQIFEDRATQSVINRQMGKTDFTVEKKDGSLFIKTERQSYMYV